MRRGGRLGLPGAGKLGLYQNVASAFVPVPPAAFVDQADVHDASVLTTDTFDLTIPTHAEGDLLFMCVQNTTSNPAGITVTTSGWTEALGTSHTQRQEWWYKYGNGSETTVTIRNDDASTRAMTAYLIVVRGVALESQGGPFDVTPITAHSVNDTSLNAFDPTDITVVTNDSLFVVGLAGWDGGTSWVDPAGYTDHGVSTSADRGIAMASKQVDAGSENPGTGTSVNFTAGSVFSFVLKGAP
jgi:hypothetical protein